MYSFVKELDERTLSWVRHLAESEKELTTQHRYAIRVFVIWIGGNENALMKFAKDHDIKDLPMGIIDADDETLNPWRISKSAHNTTVLLHFTRPLAVLSDLDSAKPEPFQQAVTEHFQRFRRCKSD